MRQQKMIMPSIRAHELASACWGRSTNLPPLWVNTDGPCLQLQRLPRAADRSEVSRVTLGSVALLKMMFAAFHLNPKT